MFSPHAHRLKDPRQQCLRNLEVRDCALSRAAREVRRLRTWLRDAGSHFLYTDLHIVRNTHTVAPATASAAALSTCFVGAVCAGVAVRSSVSRTGLGPGGISARSATKFVFVCQARKARRDASSSFCCRADGAAGARAAGPQHVGARHARGERTMDAVLDVHNVRGLARASRRGGLQCIAAPCPSRCAPVGLKLHETDALGAGVPYRCACKTLLVSEKGLALAEAALLACSLYLQAMRGECRKRVQPGCQIACACRVPRLPLFEEA